MNDTFVTIDFPQSGTYSLDLTYFQRSGGSEAELYATPGRYTAWTGTGGPSDATSGANHAGVWQLVGDTTSTNYPTYTLAALASVADRWAYGTPTGGGGGNSGAGNGRVWALPTRPPVTPDPACTATTSAAIICRRSGIAWLTRAAKISPPRSLTHQQVRHHAAVHGSGWASRRMATTRRRFGFPITPTLQPAHTDSGNHVRANPTLSLGCGASGLSNTSWIPME